MVIILVLVWRKSAHFDEDMHKMHIFVSSDLDLWPLDLKFAAQLLLSNAICFRWIKSFYGFPNSRKLEIRERDGRTDGQTDGVQPLMRPPRMAA